MRDKLLNIVEVRVVKQLCLLFITCAFLSFGFAVVTNTFNGDFLGMEIRLSVLILVFNLGTTCLPFILIWFVYKKFKKKPTNKLVTIPLSFFFYFLIFIMFWNAIVTVLYGVGIMGAPPYYAPPIIKPVIQIMNRFNYQYGVFIYILATPKSNRKQFLLVFVLFILAYLRAGLGVFMYLGMIFYLKYSTEIIYYVRKKLYIFVALLILFPTAVTFLYSVRAELRGGTSDTETTNPIFGVLVGRLSSFSDSGFILQEIPAFFISAQKLDLFYFQKQAFSVFSQNFLPAHRPEIMLYKFYYEDSDANVAYMAGTQGNLYIALMRSPISFVANLVTIIFYVYSTFYVFRLLRFKYSNELALILLLYVLMSGVSNEFAFIIFSVAVFILLFLSVNLLSVRNTK